MFVLLACAGAELPKPVDSADTAPGETTTPCPVEGTFTVEGDLVPGATLTLTAPEEVHWGVSAGTLDAETGTSVQWTLPTDIAVHVPETLEFYVTIARADCVVTGLGGSITVDWPETSRVAVLYNPSVAGSEDVARYYAAFRDIPDAQLCGIPADNADTLDGDTFVAWGTAVMACIHTIGAQVMYIVPVWGVPYHASGRVDNIGGGSQKAVVSVDALLAWGQGGVEATAADYHPAYRDGDSTTGTYEDWKPFGEIRDNRRSLELYMVARIDGASADAAMDLVDRTATAEATTLSGTVYVDGNRGDTPPTTDEFGSYESGEWNMWGTRNVFLADGRYPVVWDGNSAEFGTDPAPLLCPDALYYAGWYSYYHYNDVFTWVPGAIGGHLDSCSACDIRTGTTWSAMALQRGITATFGAVSEPYVAGMPEYDQFFLYLLDGASYGEAAYESTILGRWMMVWVGDPLYRPYRP